jgi:hypothetical protein
MSIAAADPRDFVHSFSASIPDFYHEELPSSLELVLQCWPAAERGAEAEDGAPELRVFIAAHCLGVLKGELLLRFFDCLRTGCSYVAALNRVVSIGDYRGRQAEVAGA